MEIRGKKIGAVMMLLIYLFYFTALDVAPYVHPPLNYVLKEEFYEEAKEDVDHPSGAADFGFLCREAGKE